MVGPMREPLGFYAHRILTMCKTADEAWTQAGPGDAVIITEKKERPGTLHAIDVPALVDQKRLDVHCMLFVKPR